jgi:hypothetical protein
MPQRPTGGNLQAPIRCLQKSQTTASAPVVTIHRLLGSISGGLVQPASTGTQHHFSYVDIGCLNSCKGVIFLGSHWGGGHLKIG